MGVASAQLGHHGRKVHALQGNENKGDDGLPNGAWAASSWFSNRGPQDVLRRGWQWNQGDVRIVRINTNCTRLGRRKRGTSMFSDTGGGWDTLAVTTKRRMQVPEVFAVRTRPCVT